MGKASTKYLAEFRISVGKKTVSSEYRINRGPWTKAKDIDIPSLSRCCVACTQKRCSGRKRRTCKGPEGVCGLTECVSYKCSRFRKTGKRKARRL